MAKRKRAGMKSIENLDVHKGDVDHEYLGTGKAQIIRKRIEDTEDDPIDHRRHGDFEYENFIEADCNYPTIRKYD